MKTLQVVIVAVTVAMVWGGEEINQCSPNPCQNGGTCADEVNGYTCSCVDGYTGTDCETDIDECATALCENGGICTPGVNSYACACPAGTSGTNCEASSLVAFWPLNERDGLRDISGNDIQASGSDVDWSAGPFSGDAAMVVEMKGTSTSYISIPNNNSIGRQMTWTAYVYAYTTGGTSTGGSLFSWCANPQCATTPNSFSTHLWYLKATDSNPGIFFRPVTNHILRPQAVLHSGTTDDAWLQIAVVLDSQEGVMSAWVNSVSVDLDISSVVPFDFDTDTDMRIGADRIDGRIIKFKIACIKLYNTALNMATYDWNQESVRCSQTRLMGNWPFTETHSFDDISGFGNDATGSGVTWVSVSGASSKVMNIDGSANSYVEIANTGGLLSVWRSFTWVGQVFVVQASGSAHVFAWLPPANSGYADKHNTYILVNSNTGEVSAFAMKNGAVVHQITHSGIVTGAWNKITVSMDGNAGTMEIRINGANHATTGLGTFDFDTGNNIRIGKYPDDARTAHVRLMCVQLHNAALNTASYDWGEQCPSAV